MSTPCINSTFSGMWIMATMKAQIAGAEDIPIAWHQGISVNMKVCPSKPGPKSFKYSEQFLLKVGSCSRNSRVPSAAPLIHAKEIGMVKPR
mmetsp:Transcript_22917/g.47537  ORF Transcript_22917/g.47537 Transcript_22917/m.47537 type:complete len:91 (-) Transcript_22917:238-510(-)